MKGIVVAILVLMLIPTADAQLVTKNTFCTDSQTLLTNSTIIVDDGIGPPDTVSITSEEICPYGCVDKFQFISNSTFNPGDCAMGPLESSVWMGGIILVVLVVGFLVTTRLRVF